VKRSLRELFVGTDETYINTDETHIDTDETYMNTDETEQSAVSSEAPRSAEEVSSVVRYTLVFTHECFWTRGVGLRKLYKSHFDYFL
jgi:hypothetical protein